MAEEAVVEDYVARGLSIKEICKKHKISPYRVYYVLGRRGIVIRRGARGPLGMVARVYENRIVMGRAIVEELRLKAGARYRISVLKKEPIELRLEQVS